MDNYSATLADLQEYSNSQQQQQQGYEVMMKPPLRQMQMMIMGEAPHHHHENNNNNGNNSMEHFLLPTHNNQSSSLSSPPQSGFDKLMSFSDVMQFADFGPKLALNHHHHHYSSDDNKAATNSNSMEDPVYFLKFPVLNDRDSLQEADERSQQLMTMSASAAEAEAPDHQVLRFDDDYVEGGAGAGPNTRVVVSGPNNTAASEEVQRLQFLGANSVREGGAAATTLVAAKNNNNNNNNNKRKRAPRSLKTSEEVESQRMTHIAVERNRRKQMNEHLRVLRSLMPGSYVQRGDQASIIGGAIEFVRELEQLLQCLESQKRRRLYGEATAANPHHRQIIGADNNSIIQQQQQPSSSVFFPSAGNIQDDDDEAAAAGLVVKQVADLEESSSVVVAVREETAENKSCLADVEVKVLGFDAMIKVLSRRRPGQLIRAIAALEDLQLNILHTNITTIEQTVLYSFNVKVESEGGFTAEEIASSVQQIFTFIHASSGGGGGGSSSM